MIRSAAKIMSDTLGRPCPKQPPRGPDWPIRRSGSFSQNGPPSGRRPLRSRLAARVVRVFEKRVESAGRASRQQPGRPGGVAVTRPDGRANAPAQPHLATRLAHWWNGAHSTLVRRDIFVEQLPDGRYQVRWHGGEWQDRDGQFRTRESEKPGPPSKHSSATNPRPRMNAAIVDAGRRQHAPDRFGDVAGKGGGPTGHCGSRRHGRSGGWLVERLGVRIPSPRQPEPRGASEGGGGSRWCS